MSDVVGGQEAGEGLLLESFEPMKIARVAREAAYGTGEGVPGLWWHAGAFWAWRGGVWVRRVEADVRGDLFRVLEDAYRRETVKGVTTHFRYAPTKPKVDDVMDAMKGLAASKWARLPAWVRSGEGLPNPEECVGFPDAVVCVTDGEVRVVEGGAGWLDPGMMRVPWDPEAKCPRWDRALQEWSEGDQAWVDLLQEWMGYCLLPTRRFEKWLAMLAPVRSGKGTIVTVQSEMMGEGSVLSKDFKAMKGEYGLAGLESARVLVINEVKQSDSWEGEEVTRVVKSLVGQDPLTINSGKWRPVLENVRSRAAVMMCSNEIPNLPNRAGGLSSKMVVLPFRKSFAGREDVGMKEQLVREELVGIAAWCMRGAARLLGKRPEERWQMTDVAKDRVRTYEMLSNVFQHFLEEVFVKDPEGFVVDEVVREQWRLFLIRNKLGKVNVPEKQLMVRLEAENGWGVTRVRSKRAEARDQWGLMGCSLRREVLA